MWTAFLSFLYVCCFYRLPYDAFIHRVHGRACWAVPGRGELGHIHHGHHYTVHSGGVRVGEDLVDKTLVGDGVAPDIGVGNKEQLDGCVVGEARQARLLTGPVHVLEVSQERLPQSTVVGNVLTLQCTIIIIIIITQGYPLLLNIKKL